MRCVHCASLMGSRTPGFTVSSGRWPFRSSLLPHLLDWLLVSHCQFHLALVRIWRQDVRTGSPGQNSTLTLSAQLVGEGHYLESISLSFKYIAGCHTPAPHTAQPPTTR
eukprot:COSAG01_NODE_2985_length_6752_cov_133.017736_9_plen_109_part_00